MICVAGAMGMWVSLTAERPRRAEPHRLRDHHGEHQLGDIAYKLASICDVSHTA
jgi:hypothetical protein